MLAGYKTKVQVVYKTKVQVVFYVKQQEHFRSMSLKDYSILSSGINFVVLVAILVESIEQMCEFDVPPTAKVICRRVTV